MTPKQIGRLRTIIIVAAIYALLFALFDHAQWGSALDPGPYRLLKNLTIVVAFSTIALLALGLIARRPTPPDA